MKITSVKLFPVHTPRETGSISQHVIVKISTDGSTAGLGEMSDLGHMAFMPDVTDLERSLNKALVGLDPFELLELERRLGRYGGIIGSGLDIALHDLRAKALDLPLYELLGGAYRRKIKVCYPIFAHRSEDEVQANIDRIGRILDQGFDMIRLYIGANLEADELFLKRLGEAYGDKVKIKSLDMSGRFDWKTAIKVINRFSDYDFMLVESPCRDVDGKARVRDEVEVPISEHTGSFAQALEFAKKKAVDIFNLAVVSGGIRHAKKLFVLAEVLNIKCLIGTTQELSIGTAAQAHVGASVPNLDFPCDPAGGRLYTEDVVKERVKYEDGYLIVPEGPGLGMELDEDKLEKLTRPLTASGR